jgi:hypothetical protein
VKNQTTWSQNGIYVVQAGAWTRAPDADTSAKWRYGTLVSVENWSGAANAGLWWTEFNTAPGSFVLGTSDIEFWNLLTYSYGALSSAPSVPALTAGVWTTINHVLNTSDIQATFSELVSQKTVDLDWEVVSGSSIRVRSDVSVAANFFRCVLVGGANS